MTDIETQLGGLLPWLYEPVLAVIVAGAIYTVWLAGRFFIEATLRLIGSRSTERLAAASEDAMDLDSLELVIMRELEATRLLSRVMPMLGLIATMVPLGPALAAVASRNDPFAGTNVAASSTVALGSAFAAVVISLLTACIAFAIHTVRRRWLLTELDAIRRKVES